MVGELVLIVSLIIVWLVVTLTLVLGVAPVSQSCPECYCPICLSLTITPLLVVLLSFVSPVFFVSETLLSISFGMGVMGIASLFIQNKKEKLKEQGKPTAYLKEKIVASILLALVVVYKMLEFLKVV